MPLLPNALNLIRRNLEQIANGERPPTVTVGVLTAKQLKTINRYRAKYALPAISGEVFFIGRHVHESRILKDGYSIDDVLEQIASAFSEKSKVVNGQKLTAIQNAESRNDRYGNKVRDEIVLECWRHNPMSQLFSVVPRGDVNKPIKKNGAAVEAAPKK